MSDIISRARALLEAELADLEARIDPAHEPFDVALSRRIDGLLAALAELDANGPSRARA